MPGQFDFAVIESISSVEVGHVCYLRPTSFVLLLSCLSQLVERWQWRNEEAILDDSEWDIVEAWLANASNELMDNTMLGSVLTYCVSALPDNVLLCDGTTYDKDDYPLLWAVLPSGMRTSDQFTVPDLRDKFIRGGIISGIGATGGEDNHTLTTNELPSHRHGLWATGDLDVESVGIPQPNAMQLSPVVTLYTDYTGGGQAHENRPAFYTLVYGIVAW